MVLHHMLDRLLLVCLRNRYCVPPRFIKMSPNILIEREHSEFILLIIFLLNVPDEIYPPWLSRQREGEKF